MLKCAVLFFPFFHRWLFNYLLSIHCSTQELQIKYVVYVLPDTMLKFKKQNSSPSFLGHMGSFKLVIIPRDLYRLWANESLWRLQQYLLYQGDTLFS